MLDSAQKQFYMDNGYLVIERFLTDEQCEHYILQAEEASTDYSTTLNLHDRSSEFLDLLRYPSLLRLIDDLQNARMIPIGSIFFWCKPEYELDNGSVPHQDNYSVKSPYGSYFVTTVAFDNANTENGSLIVYPRSHKLGDLPNTPSKNFEYDENGKVIKIHPIGNPVNIPDEYLPVQLEYPKGSLIFLHGHIIHYAQKNPSETQWRRQFYMHYIKDGDPFWPGWNARRRLIERNM